MRIRFQVSGGIAFFPGLARPSEIDLDSLGAQEREHLEQLFRESHFFERAARPSPGRSAPDCQTYRITVEDGATRHTVTVSDPVTDPLMAQLIDALRDLQAKGR
jgi:hypothetical protein